MPHDTLEPASTTTPPPAADPADRAAADMIARAKAILAGRLKPEPMVTPPEVAAFIESEKARFAEPLDPDVIQHMTDALNLQHYYPDRTIARYTTPEGVLVVLADGMENYLTLIGALSYEERRRVLNDFP